MDESYLKFLDFSTESYDMERIVLEELEKAGYERCDFEEKVKQLEQAVIKYSIAKLEMWHKPIPEDINLDTLLDNINTYIPDKSKQEFFKQYILSILRILKKFNRQDKIQWIQAELDCDAVFFKEKNNIKLLITNEKTEDYKLPTAILEDAKKLTLKKSSTTK